MTGLRLKDKSALISGGAGGMGASEARRFVEEGAHVVIADIDQEAGETLAEELGGAACFFRLDVTNAEQWKAAVAKAVEPTGRLDILVNNAGIFRTGMLIDTPVEEFQLLNEINVIGSFLGLQAAARNMRAAGGGGSIINISSAGGLVGVSNRGAYVATKHAVIGLTRTAAIELGPEDIRVNSVCPGGIETKMVAELHKSANPQKQFRAIPLRRFGRAEEIADLVVYLASDESRYCTGAQFVIDGGIIAGLPI